MSEKYSGFQGLGCTSSCKIAAFEHTEKSIYGIQFHPEVSHTDYGKDIIQNYLKTYVKLKIIGQVTFKNTPLIELKNKLGITMCYVHYPAG